MGALAISAYTGTQPMISIAFECSFNMKKVQLLPTGVVGECTRFAKRPDVYNYMSESHLCGQEEFLWDKKAF